MEVSCEYASEMPYASDHVKEAAFAYCTDERWLACPATYCPLYDVQVPTIESWRMLPCAENFKGYYLQDEAADVDLDDYLWVKIVV